MAFLYGASLPNMAQRTATRLQPPIVVGRASMLPSTDQMTLTQAIPTAPAVGRASMLPATDQMTLTQVIPTAPAVDRASLALDRLFIIMFRTNLNDTVSDTFL